MWVLFPLESLRKHAQSIHINHTFLRVTRKSVAILLLKEKGGGFRVKLLLKSFRHNLRFMIPEKGIFRAGFIEVQLRVHHHHHRNPAMRWGEGWRRRATPEPWQLFYRIFHCFTAIKKGTHLPLFSHGALTIFDFLEPPFKNRQCKYQTRNFRHKYQCSLPTEEPLLLWWCKLFLNCIHKEY